MTAMPDQDEDADQAGRIALIMALRRQGIKDNRILSVIERTPRDLFVPSTFQAQAYEDHALPIECGQTISQPYVVAFMTEKLEVSERMKVLEIGTGSGYQTAVLARLCRRVYTIERYRTLLKDATARFEQLGLTNVTSKAGDGALGWPEQAPFDRIIVTAAAAAVPQKLVEQLKVGGVMIVPIDTPKPEDGQSLWRIERTEDGIKKQELLPVRFVPLVEGIARES